MNRPSLLSAAVLALSLNGCADTDVNEHQTDEITDIHNSSVKSQAIGNCWIYASIGWVESLHLTQSGGQLNLSESYLTYWHWFEQIRGGAPGEIPLGQLKDGNLTMGGTWAVAAELMRRYGVMTEGKFIAADADL